MALTKTELDRLQDSMTFSRKKLRPFRQNQLEALKQYVGVHYSDNGSDDIVPINFIELALNIYIQHLAARRPNAFVTTNVKELKPVALKMGLDTNNILRELKFGDVIQNVVRQAMFSIGIIKVGLHNTLSVQIDGQYYPLGEPFAMDVSLDNWVHDMTATKWGEIQDCGDRYTVPFDDIGGLGLEGKFINQLQPNDISATLDEEGNEKADSLTQDSEMVQEQYRDTVDLWDIWLPHKNMIITIADQVDVIGKSIDWEGPTTGPYRFLKFNDVIDNIMPLSPVATWIDLHTLENKLFRKLGRQASRQKTGVGVQGGADADGKRVVDFNDGDVFRLDNPKAVTEFKTGGIDQESLLFLLQVKELANYFYGNLNAMGGLERGAETLGQDQLLTANASKRLESMQEKTIEFTTEVIKDICWYRWTDPIRSFPVTIKKYGEQIQTALRLKERETDFFHFNFEIEAFSMQHQTPASKVAALMQIYTQVIAPQVPILAQQGIFVDFEAFMKILARYTNLSELNDILIYANPTQPDSGPKGQSIRQAPNTTRRYIREGRPGPTSAGSDRVMSQLLTGSVNNDQKAQLTSPK